MSVHDDISKPLSPIATACGLFFRGCGARKREICLLLALNSRGPVGGHLHGQYLFQSGERRASSIDGLKKGEG